MPSFKPKANKKIMVSKKSNVTVDSKHQEKMNEFKNIDDVVIPNLKKEKQKYKKLLKKKNITLDQQLELKDNIKKCSKKIKEYEEKFPNQNNVPRPSHWSGWRLLPEEIEFWLDGEGRIHERLNYRKKNGEWNRELLYP